MKLNNFPTTITVLVKDSVFGGYFFDAMDGLNVGHALWRARDNWGERTILAVCEGDVLSTFESNPLATYTAEKALSIVRKIRAAIA
ncbi:hypothetical protein [Saccharopolyspora pogona]|uniref:hypothetical protein n=1 Tax=Saccharopolyspora pogona TaxID=333966 RepID=UPI001685AEA1|nr:hypothetical protein [Saccharopolyspora pogona]